MNNNKKLNAFTGTIDDLLNHTSKLDVSEFYKDEDVQMSDEEAIDYVIKKCNVDRDEAKRIYENLKLEEVSEMVNKLVEKGLLEIVGYNESGEALYQQTELGKKYVENILKSQEHQKEDDN